MRAAFALRLVNPAKGRPKSAEWKRKHAERLRAGISGYKTSRRMPYERSDGRRIIFRSEWEWLTAQYFDQNGIAWEFEPAVLQIGSDTYLPDFQLADGRYIEVKGYFPLEQRAKMERFKAVYAIEVWDEGKLKELGILQSRASRRSPPA